MKLYNPILTGFHPDPCICRANGKYYLVTSTFEWYPGVSLYESEDLINWKCRGGILKKLNLEGIPDSAGIWAPSLTYDGEKFYLIYTVCRQIDGYFKDLENYLVTAESMDGEWSAPVFINASGFDPGMYHENGKHYVVNPQWDPRPLKGHRKFNGLIMQEFSMEQKKLVGDSQMIFKGSPRGGCEGPHILKKDGWYYLLTAVGGTGRHHSITAARAESLWGPYQTSPIDPLITSWEQPTDLKKAGHGNFVETPDGRWYMVHLCARYLEKKQVCPLGRETAIQEMKWTNGWPQMVQENVCPSDHIEIQGEREAKSKEYQTDFPENMRWEQEEWLTLRKRGEAGRSLIGEGIQLAGGASLTSLFNQSLLARRWNSFHFQVETELIYHPYHYLQTAGLTCYYNTKAFYYLNVGFDEKQKKRVLSILKNDNFSFWALPEEETVTIEDSVKRIRLRADIEQDCLQFYYALDEEAYQMIGKPQDAAILSDEHVQGWAYTGAVIGITAVDNFNKDTTARFTKFVQREL